MKVRFFCDGCGAAVGARAERCPSCGKFFSAVRCPSCGYQGKAHEFSDGCPVCGYLAETAGDGPKERPAPLRRRPERSLGSGLTRPAALAAGAALVGALLLLVVMLLRS